MNGTELCRQRLIINGEINVDFLAKRLKEQKGEEVFWCEDIVW